MITAAGPFVWFLLDNADDPRSAMPIVSQVLIPFLDRIERNGFRVSEGATVDPLLIQGAIAKAIRKDVKNVQFVLCRDPLDRSTNGSGDPVIDPNETLSWYIGAAWDRHMRYSLVSAFGKEGWKPISDELTEKLSGLPGGRLSANKSLAHGNSEASESIRTVLRAMATAILTNDGDLAKAMIPLITAFDHAIPVGRIHKKDWIAVLLPLRT